MRSSFVRPLTIAAALVAGFGLTLGPWLFAGYPVALRIGEAQPDAVAVSARYLQAKDLLSAVRAQVFVASVLVREALLDRPVVSDRVPQTSRDVGRLRP